MLERSFVFLIGHLLFIQLQLLVIVLKSMFNWTIIFGFISHSSVALFTKVHPQVKPILCWSLALRKGITVHEIWASLQKGPRAYIDCLILLAECRIIVSASAVEKERSRRLGTSILNQVVREALAFKSPPRTRGGKRGRVYYCTQVPFFMRYHVYICLSVLWWF